VVKSSPIIALQPSVPNLIFVVFILSIQLKDNKVTNLAKYLKYVKFRDNYQPLSRNRNSDLQKTRCFEMKNLEIILSDQQKPF
jgi:hypothetical protein